MPVKTAAAESIHPDPAHAVRITRIRRRLGSGLDTLDAALAELDVTAAPSEQVAQAAFRRARHQFKALETLLEFYSPTTTAALNRPVADEEGDEQTVGKLQPTGFQRIEPALFPSVDRAQWADVRKEVAAMRTEVHRFHGYLNLVAPTEPHLFEAARRELASVTTLGIAGFDATASGDAIREAAASLEGLSETMQLGMRLPPTELTLALDSASTYLRAHPDFNTFDRFTFITRYANPAFRALAEYGQVMPERPLPLRQIWPTATASAYDARGFDAMGYAPDIASRPTHELAALGQALFFDPLLSGNGERACASCHLPERAFTDGMPHARPFATGDPIALRNTPSLVNVAYQPALFADERAGSLEEQVATVLASPTEMHSNVDAAVARVRQSAEYRTWFARAAARPQDTAITSWTLRVALATYLRTLNGMNSRFDRAIRANAAKDSAVHTNDTLTGAERRGFNVFMGKAKCGTCHFAPLFNGSAPPLYDQSEVEIIGALSKPAAHASHIDADQGRGGFDHLPAHQHAFKTPTVRNAALTAPYMHNGAYATLDQVVDFYNSGGGAGAGADVPYQTLDPSPLRLTPAERHDLIAFLGALTDTVGITGRPSRLPRLDSATSGSTRRTSDHARGRTHAPDRPIGGRY